MQTVPAILLGISPLILSMAAMVLGTTLLGTVLAIKMDLEGIPVEAIGLIMSLYSLGFVAGTLLCPGVVRRVGHIRAFAAFAALASGSALLHAFHIDPYLWAVLRTLTGFCAAFLFIILESWLNAKAPNHMRGQVMSVYMVFYYAAAGGSQALLVLFDTGGVELLLLVAIALSVSLVPLALARVESPDDIPAARLRLIELIRISPMGVVGCFSAGLIISAFNSLAPVYARTIDLSPGWVAQFMTTAILAGFVLQYPLGRLSDRFDRRLVVVGVTATLSAVGTGMALFAPISTFIALPLVAAYGALSLALYPLCLSHANDYLKPHQLVPAAAGLLLCYGVGAIAGPLLASAAMEFGGRAALFHYIAVVSGCFSVFVLYRMRRREALPSAEQSTFVAVPQTTYIFSELDPRYEPDDGQLSFDFEAVPAPAEIDADGADGDTDSRERDEAEALNDEWAELPPDTRHTRQASQ